MLPDLEKILAADRTTRASVAQAQKQAQEIVEQAQAKILAMQKDLEQELASLKEALRAEILQKAEARAADTEAATKDYLYRLQEQAPARQEEAAAFLVSRVLEG